MEAGKNAVQTVMTAVVALAANGWEEVMWCAAVTGGIIARCTCLDVPGTTTASEVYLVN